MLFAWAMVAANTMQALYVVTTHLMIAAAMIVCMTFESPSVLCVRWLQSQALDTLTIYNQNGQPKPSQFELGLWEDGALAPDQRSITKGKGMSKHTMATSQDGMSCSVLGRMFNLYGVASLFICLLGSTFWMPSYIERRIKLDA